MGFKDKVDNHPVIVILGIIALVVTIVAGGVAIYEFAKKEIPVSTSELTTVSETSEEEEAPQEALPGWQEAYERIIRQASEEELWQYYLIIDLDQCGTPELLGFAFYHAGEEGSLSIYNYANEERVGIYDSDLDTTLSALASRFYWSKDKKSFRTVHTFQNSAALEETYYDYKYERGKLNCISMTQHMETLVEGPISDINNWQIDYYHAKGNFLDEAELRQEKNSISKNEYVSLVGQYNRENSGQKYVEIGRDKMCSAYATIEKGDFNLDEVWIK